MSAQRITLDVSRLPKHGFDTKTQLWWGNALLLCIETTMFGLVVAAATVLRFYEFRSLVWSWDSNAYGSISWAILALHLVHLIVGTLEDVFLATWVWLRPLDENHALDITVTAVYWYWVVGTWLLLYPVVYLSPRFM